MYTEEEQVFIGSTKKKWSLCTNCNKPRHTIETCWDECGGKEGQGPRQEK